MNCNTSNLRQRRGWMVALMTLALPLLGAAPAPQAQQAPQVRYTTASKGTQVAVDGTSTLHDWTVKSPTITGDLFLPGQWRDKDSGVLVPRIDAASLSPAIVLEIPVFSLVSGDKGLDNKMYEAMNAKKFPTVRYELEQVDVKNATVDASQKFTVQTTGKLTVSGKTRTEPLELVIAPTKTGFTVTTRAMLKMTDFGIKPPTALFGVIRSGDAVTVTATWALTNATPAPQRAQQPGTEAMRQAVTNVLATYEQARAALAAGDALKAPAAIADLSQQVQALAGADASNLDAQARAQWTATVAALRTNTAAAGRSKDLRVIRSAFNGVSATLERLVKTFGHNLDRPVLAFNVPDPGARNAGATLMWLATTGGAESPYAGPAGKAPQPVARLVSIILSGPSQPGAQTNPQNAVLAQ